MNTPRIRDLPDHALTGLARAVDKELCRRTKERSRVPMTSAAELARRANAHEETVLALAEFSDPEVAYRVALALERGELGA